MCSRCPPTENPPDLVDLPVCEHGILFAERCAECDAILADAEAHERALADEIDRAAERDPRPDDGPDDGDDGRDDDEERDGQGDDPDDEEVPAL